jgi:hypothetical protein
MTQLPPAIVFVNQDITEPIKNVLIEQLYIDETITITDFEQRLLGDAQYTSTVHNSGTRLLVIVDDFRNYSQRNLADIVIFVKQGLATVLKNNYGPPGLAVPVSNINIYQLLRYNNSPFVVILPDNTRQGSSGLGGIFAIQAEDLSGVHDVNPDNEANNEDFINRK